MLPNQISINYTLRATSEQDAVQQVQALHPENYIYCLGKIQGYWNVFVYLSRDDYEADESDGGHYRMVAKYFVRENND